MKAARVVRRGAPFTITYPPGNEALADEVRRVAERLAAGETLVPHSDEIEVKSASLTSRPPWVTFALGFLCGFLFAGALAGWVVVW